MDRISTHDVAAATGASYRQVDYWCRTGVLAPRVAAHGSGTRRRFDDREVMVAAAVHALADLGAEGPALTTAAQFLRHGRFDGVVFVDPAGDVVADPELAGMSGWVLNLDQLAQRVETRRGVFHAMAGALVGS